MTKCINLLELDIFSNVKVKAGKNALDRKIGGVYPKHTKSIVEWVRGEELILVSGYEHGVDEENLLQLVEEAFSCKCGAILVEGGINFKELPQSVIDKADALNIPLLFVRGVISFYELSREVYNLIFEKKYYMRQNTCILEQLVGGNCSNKDMNQLFSLNGIPLNSNFLAVSFAIACKEEKGEKNSIADFFNILTKYMEKFYEKFEICQICKKNFQTIDYVLYADNNDEFVEMKRKLEEIHQYINMEQDIYQVYLGYSSIVEGHGEILNSIEEANFTIDVIKKTMMSKDVKSFSDIGSYQMIFYVDDKSKLLRFRNDYLMKVYEADKNSESELLHTLKEFLLQNGNILQAAKVLYVHRNTLKYRLEKIEKIIGKDINDPYIKNELLYAFIILDMMPFE